MPKSSKNQLLELAGESLLERLKEFKDNKKKSRDSCDQKLLDEVTSGELVSVKSKESEDKNPGRELIRYHSVVDLEDDDLGDDFSSCADSVDMKGPAGTGTLQQVGLQNKVRVFGTVCYLIIDIVWECDINTTYLFWRAVSAELVNVYVISGV